MIDKLAYKTFFSLCSSRCFRDRRLNIFIYHRVLKEHDPLKPDIVTETEFDLQMQWASRYFNVLPMYRAAELQQQNRLPYRSLAITFDDGYLDNAEIALPILQKYGLPATFYVTKDYLSKPPKWDYLIEGVRGTALKKIQFLAQTYPLTSDTEKADFIHTASEAIKAFPDEKGNLLLSEIIDALGPVRIPRLMMDENIVRQLPCDTIELGGHGIEHCILSKVDNEVAKREIIQSKQYLETLTGREIKGFAYPNGLYPHDLGDQHAHMVREAGYDYAVTTNIGSSNSLSNPFLLNRYTPWRRNMNGFLAEVGVNYWRG